MHVGDMIHDPKDDLVKFWDGKKWKVVTPKPTKIPKRMLEPGRYRGRTVYICTGAWGGFQFRRYKHAFGVCLGWVAIGYLACDIENIMADFAEFVLGVKYGE